jgi:hypothetical protein
MDDVYSLAKRLGPCPELPVSLRDVKYTTIFLDYIDKEVINPFFHSLKTDAFIIKIVELTREKIRDVADGRTRANIALRLWCGCADSAKTIRETYVAHYPDGTKEDQPVPPEEREIVWYQRMQPRSEEDSLYKFGVELGPILRKIREQSVYLEGIPCDSIVRRYVRACKVGDVISPEDITTER